MEKEEKKKKKEEEEEAPHCERSNVRPSANWPTGDW